MTHADSLKSTTDVIRTKQEYYADLCHRLLTLIQPDTILLSSNFISILSNSAALLFGSYENYTTAFGTLPGHRINWLGFYLIPSLYPPYTSSPIVYTDPAHLLLGPFAGRPACQYIPLTSKRSLGVCAEAFLSRRTVTVNDVEMREGHIACDAETKAEMVVPLIVKSKRTGEDICVGVLDIDCEALNAFTEEDRVGMETIVKALVELIDWGVV